MALRLGNCLAAGKSSGQKQRAKAGAKARVNALPCDLFELRLDCCNDPGRERLGLRRK